MPRTRSGLLAVLQRVLCPFTFVLVRVPDARKHTNTISGYFAAGMDRCEERAPTLDFRVVRDPRGANVSVNAARPGRFYRSSSGAGATLMPVCPTLPPGDRVLALKSAPLSIFRWTLDVIDNNRRNLPPRRTDTQPELFL